MSSGIKGGVNWRAGAVAAMAAAGLVALWGCDRGGSDRPAREHSADEGGPGNSGGNRSSGGGSSYSRGETSGPRAPVPLVDGKPMWSDNKRHTAEENADYHFQRDGADFGATSVKDYVAKVHGFVDHPPEGVDTVTRKNGDKLIYDAKSNTFAVARRDGAPRTMFKPHAGADYWKTQKEKAASGDDGYSSTKKRYHAPDPKEFDRGGDGT